MVPSCRNFNHLVCQKDKSKGFFIMAFNFEIIWSISGDSVHLVLRAWCTNDLVPFIVYLSQEFHKKYDAPQSSKYHDSLCSVADHNPASISFVNVGCSEYTSTNIAVILAKQLCPSSNFMIHRPTCEP